MAQAFWASTGFDLLGHEREGLVATDAWLAAFLERTELKPPAEAGAHELALHALVAGDARASVPSAMLAEAGGGGAGRRVRASARPAVREVRRDRLCGDAALFSFRRDELYCFGFVLPRGGEGGLSWARVVEAWMRIGRPHVSTPPTT